jgi:hypothetical protein
MKDLRKIRFYLGLQVEHLVNKFFIHQSTYTKNVLKKFYMNKIHPLSTPMIVRLLNVKMNLFRS